MKKEFIFSDRWLELMFEKRNHQYGAYVLRKRNPHNVAVGFLLSILLLVSGVFVAKKLSETTPITVPPFDGAIIFDQIYEIFKPPVTSPLEQDVTPPAPQPKTDNNMVSTLVVDSVIPVDDEKNKTAMNTDIAASTTTNTNDTAQTTETGIMSDEINKEVYGSYEALEKYPEFPGGESAMLGFLARTTKFPRQYLEERIDGATVYISFIVNKNGKVTSVKTERGIAGYPDFANAAVKAISVMPDWSPGMQNGSNVSVSYTIPVKFSIKKN